MSDSTPQLSQAQQFADHAACLYGASAVLASGRGDPVIWRAAATLAASSPGACPNLLGSPAHVWTEEWWNGEVQPEQTSRWRALGVGMPAARTARSVREVWQSADHAQRCCMLLASRNIAKLHTAAVWDAKVGGYRAEEAVKRAAQMPPLPLQPPAYAGLSPVVISASLPAHLCPTDLLGLEPKSTAAASFTRSESGAVMVAPRLMPLWSAAAHLQQERYDQALAAPTVMEGARMAATKHSTRRGTNVPNLRKVKRVVAPPPDTAHSTSPSHWALPSDKWVVARDPNTPPHPEAVPIRLAERMHPMHAAPSGQASVPMHLWAVEGGGMVSEVLAKARSQGSLHTAPLTQLPPQPHRPILPLAAWTHAGEATESLALQLALSRGTQNTVGAARAEPGEFVMLAWDGDRKGQLGSLPFPLKGVRLLQARHKGMPQVVKITGKHRDDAGWAGSTEVRHSAAGDTVTVAHTHTDTEDQGPLARRLPPSLPELVRWCAGAGTDDLTKCVGVAWLPSAPQQPGFL